MPIWNIFSLILWLNLLSNYPFKRQLKFLWPIYAVATRLPDKSAEYVKWLVIRQGDRVPATTLWSLWQRFADDFCASPLSASIDNEHSDSSKLLRELFLV